MLNIIFMVVAVVGVGLCLAGKQTIGTYVFVASIPFKFELTKVIFRAILKIETRALPANG